MTNSWRRGGVVLLVLLVLTPAFAARRPKPMYKPAPMSYPERLSQAQVAEVVRTGLAGRGWGVETEQADPDNPATLVLRAKLLIRVHEVTIDVAISETYRTVAFSYVDSKQMRYEKRKGRDFIHPKYGEWIRNLEQDIRVRWTTIPQNPSVRP